jgi:hypothetical protein
MDIDSILHSCWAGVQEACNDGACILYSTKGHSGEVEYAKNRMYGRLAYVTGGFFAVCACSSLLAFAPFTAIINGVVAGIFYSFATDFSTIYAKENVGQKKSKVIRESKLILPRPIWQKVFSK